MTATGKFKTHRKKKIGIVSKDTSVNWKMSRLQELTNGLHDCYGAVKQGLRDFIEFLKELA